MRLAIAVLSFLCASLPAAAAGATEPVPVAETPAAEAGEPKVRRSVIEDDTVRIEELRVRGQLQRVVVSPKGKAPAYEIVVPDGSRDLSEGVSSSRGAAGKRVWNLFRF